MAEQTTIICDQCKTTISHKKCDFCGKDVCGNCSIKGDIGTIDIFLCKHCEGRINHILRKDRAFWDELNKQEKLKEKTIRYIGKKLMVHNLDDSEEDYEDKDDGEDTYNLKKLFGSTKKLRDVKSRVIRRRNGKMMGGN